MKQLILIRAQLPASGDVRSEMDLTIITLPSITLHHCTAAETDKTPHQ